MPKLHMLHSVTDTINTSFILQSETSTIVIDGGFPTEAEYLYEYLKNLGGHVDCWYLTHIHDDHVSAMTKIVEEHPDIKIDRVCCNFPAGELIDQWEPMQGKVTSSAVRAWVFDTLAEKNIPVITPKCGDVHNYDGYSVRVLRDPHEELCNNINDSSLVYRVTVGEASILFLGDLGVAGGKQLLADSDPALLKADYVQMAHHGQNGVSRDVYEAIKPSYCLWCTPTWLWDNMGPGGYDTNQFKTVVVRGWMSEIGGIKRHYKMQEGDHIIEL